MHNPLSPNLRTTMHNPSKPHCVAVLAAALILNASASMAQAPQPPPPEATDPVKLELMKGFPPAPEKIVRLSTVLKFPNGRWAFHHMRELGPTAQVWRGDEKPLVVREAPQEIGALRFEDDKGGNTTLADWQRTTFTDGLLVLHKGAIVYQKHYSGMAAHQPHSLWSMSKSFTGLLATMLIKEGTIDPNALVTKYLPELKDSAWADATVQQTLDMTTGVAYKEDFRDPSSGIFQYLHAAGLLPAPPTFSGPRTIPDLLVTIKKEGEHGAGFKYKTVDTEVIGGVPTALSAVLKVDPKGTDLSRVRINICGAALLARSVAEQMEHLTGKPVREVYGMTESGGVICVDPVSRARVIGSAGCPIPFCEVEARVLDGTSASSHSCMPGEPGVLVVRGPNVTPGYKDAGQSAALFTEDGWLITGDVGYVDATGRVFITGRAKDVIIRGGHNIDPAVIEECLMRHPAVADAGAVGMPDAYAGEVPVAYVMLRQGVCVTEEELLAFAKATINEPPALPRRLFILEQLPMTAVGKIYKPTLRQDCARRHLLQVLQGEPIAALAVREEPGRGQVVCIELAAAEEGSARETRQRIAADLNGYLLTLEWATSQASPA